MAARNAIARLIGKSESVPFPRGKILLQQCPQQRQAAGAVASGSAAQQHRHHHHHHHHHRHHHAMANTNASTFPSATPLIISSPRKRIIDSNDARFSTSILPTTSSTSTSTSSSNSNSKRSPHSKLLRVCSERNTNSHFAAIEADLLRLDWKESMDALVHDWTSPHQNNTKQRFDDFIELERNVRTYVRNNIADLTRIEKSHVREYKHANKGIIERSPSLSLEDHIRFRYFPYEDLIVRIMNRAVDRDGEYVLSTYESKSIGGDERKKPMAEVHGRIGLLARAGTLLDAMTSSFRDADDGGGGDTDDGDDETDNEDDRPITSNDTYDNTYNNNQHLWTIHHTSCSNCYRSVLSGWFLLYRRLREANRKILADDSELDASDVLEATTKLDVHPEEEALVRAEKWIEFCTGVDAAAAGGREAEDGGNAGGEGAGEKGGDGSEGGKTLLSGGILPSDEPLLMGVVKILSMSENSKRRMQAIELDNKLKELFPEMNE